jgi:hypothetical protein
MGRVCPGIKNERPRIEWGRIWKVARLSRRIEGSNAALAKRRWRL